MGAAGLPTAYAQQAGGDAGSGIKPRGTIWNFTYENWRLPGGEDMGMAGANLLYDFGEHLRLGIGTYGAVRGERGGFITLGLAGQLHQQLSDSWAGHLGFYVGAGGGRSDTDTKLQGGGLMLRGDLGLDYETHGYGNFGLGVSYVQFPSGSIHSWQPYISYSYPFYSLLSSGWGSGSGGGTGTASLPQGNSEFGLVLRDYRIAASSTRDDGTPQHRNMQLLGAQWLSYLDDRWFLKLEAEGAMGGESNGYMQILAGGGYRLPLSSNVAVKLYGAAGPAGGGGVDTGGGLLLEGGAALQVGLTKRTSLDLSVGALRSPSASFKAYSVGLSLNYRFGLPRVSSSDTVSWSSLGDYEPSKLRLRLTNQTYFKGASNWRNHSVDQPVSNLGAQLDYFVTPRWFLTGQGLAAYAGDAGSYMTGLVGVGTHLPLSQRWFLEGEALVGAAGGGGLAVGGGLIGQVNASLGYRISPSLSLMATVGHADALHNGDFRAYVAGLSLAYRFDSFTAK